MNEIKAMIDGETLIVQVPEEDLEKVERVIVCGHQCYKEFYKDDWEGEERC